jgi:hypothetical protein
MKNIKSRLSMLLLFSFISLIIGCGGSTARSIQELQEVSELAEELVWETDSHFTDGHQGSYTLQIDDGPIYTHLKDDIILMTGTVSVPAVVDVSEGATSILFSATPILTIGETATISEDDNASGLIWVNPDVNNETDATYVESLTFIATSGTISRLSRDHVHIDAYMAKDDGTVKHLVSDIYIGASVLTGS